jgi:negative regulator of sigma E activity
MGRYALIGEVMRTGTAPVPSPGFATRISQAIAADTGQLQPAPTTVAPPHREVRRWIRPVGGAAVAAGVAALAVMALQPQLDPESQTDRVTQIVAVGSAPPAANDRYIVTSGTPASQVVPATYLAKYVMAHSEYALPLGRRAFLSSVLSDDESELSESIDMSIPSDTEPQPGSALQR